MSILMDAENGFYVFKLFSFFFFSKNINLINVFYHFFFLVADKSVSFEKSVSFSDDIQGLPKSHSPQHPGKSMSLKITAV